MKSAVIVAGGSSSRFGKNKLFAPLFGKTLIEVTVSAFQGVADEIILVANAEDVQRMRELFDYVKIVEGGDTRTRSAENGLNALSPDSTVVAIHDGARPYVSRELIKTCFETAERQGCAVPVIAPVDAVYIKEGNKVQLAAKSDVCLVQTPQTFATKHIKEAYAQRDMTKAYGDDSEIYLEKFGRIAFVNGERQNKKITFSSDLCRTAVGNGFDAHRLVEGRKLVLCGEEIPYELGLEGHSDADVALHAIMDAVLSAIGERDIGVQFPDTDPRYEGISSMILLKKVAEMASENNAEVQSVSCVIMAQAPRLSPFIPKMKQNVAKALRIAPDRVNVSATTTENLGITAKNQGIAAQAVCLVDMR